jgi:hypothetical protein
MGRVNLHFSEDDYQLFHHYCANYCRLYDETRKNSIKILLELYKHQVIDIQEHSLDNIFTFFYQKKQEFETESKIPASDVDELMRIRICSDIILFLEDMEKIYRILRKKNVEANYILIIGAFSKIFEEENQMRLEDLQEAASGAINAIVSPLGEAIEQKLGPDVEIQALLYELVSFTEIFNRHSPDLTFNDEIIELLAPPFIKRFGKEENFEEIRAILQDHRDQFEIDELESALEGGIHARNVRGLEFSWQELEPLRILNELVAKNQSLKRVPLDVLSALEAPMKEKSAQAEYSQLTLYQKPYGMVRRRNDENQFLVTVDNRSHSEVQISSVTDFTPKVYLQEQKYKQYFSLAAGAMALLLIILATVFLSLYSAPGSAAAENTTRELFGTKNGTIAASAMIKTIAPTLIPTPAPTPTPVPQYVTIEPVIREPDTSPKSNRFFFEKPAAPPNISFDSNEYLTIFRNNISYNTENSYKISFDLKNPPMVIHYTVTPRNITDSKWFEPRDAAKHIDTAIVIRPDEFAWFELNISNESSLYDKQGWGVLYGIPLTTQEIVIRNPGMYHIEFSGHEVIVSSEILVKKEGNIKL